MKKIKLTFALFLIVCLSSNAQDEKGCTFESIEIVDQRPVYREAEGNLGTYIASKVEFPELAKFSEMNRFFLVQIIVDCRGKLADVILSDGDEMLRDAAERMIRTMEDWEPAVLNHKPVSTTILFMLYFKEEANEFVVSCLELTGNQSTKDESAKLQPDNDVEEVSEDSVKISIQVVDFREQDTIKQEEPGRTIYEFVEQMPEFPEGFDAMYKFIDENKKYPKKAQEIGIQGRVIVRFVVEPTGEITDVNLRRGLDPLVDKEALEVIKMMPRWTPGMQDGVAVPVYYTVPVVFRLPKK